MLTWKFERIAHTSVLNLMLTKVDFFWIWKISIFDYRFVKGIRHHLNFGKISSSN